MHAPPKPDYPVIQANDLPKFDAFLFGIPTRYGNFPAQWKVCECVDSAIIACFSYLLVLRHSGIRLVGCGRKALSLASTPAFSSRLALPEEAKVGTSVLQSLVSR